MSPKESYAGTSIPVVQNPDENQDFDAQYFFTAAVCNWYNPACEQTGKTLKFALMKTNHESSALKVVLQQTTNNTTAWMGHGLTDEDIVAGQTFTCPYEGELGGIEIFSSLVIKPGHAEMTVHPFDPSSKKWGDALLSTSVKIDKSDNEKWILFPQNGLKLQKGLTYGFRIKSEDMYIGIGEAAGSHAQPPFTGGQEWISPSDNHPGKYFNYLSLAFKVEMRA